MQNHQPDRENRIFKRLKTSLSLVWLVPCLLLLVGAILTSMNWRMVAQQNHIRRQGVFNAQLVRLVARIEGHLRTNEQMLQGVAGLFAASQDISREEFRTYFETLDLESNYPGIQGIGFAQLISPTLLESHIQSVRKEGFPQYNVRPVGVRKLYSSIVLLQPFDWRNQRTFGFDMLTEPVRREAMLRARDTGRAALSGKVQLQQETERDAQAGALLYVPIYATCEFKDLIGPCHRRLSGWAYSPLRMRDLIDSILQKEADAVAGMGVEIYDGRETNPAALMYQSRGYPATADFEATRQFTMAGQPWTLIAHSQPGFPAESNDIRGLQILLFGNLVSFLLASLAWVFLRDHARLSLALKESAEAHRLLVENQLELQAIYDTSGVAILLVDTRGVVTYANKHMAEMFATSHDELIGLPYVRLVPEREREVVPQRISGLVASDIDELVLERSYLRRDGREFWGLLSAHRLLDSAGNTRGLVGVIIDMTERRDAEERLRNSEARYRSLTEAMQDVVWILDVDTMRFTYCSPSVRLLSGYAAEEIVGASLSQIYIPETARYMGELIAARSLALQAGQEESGRYYVDELDLCHKNGCAVATEIVSIFSHDPDTGHQLLRGVTRNITDRKRHEEEQRIAAVAFESRESMIVTDAAGFVIRVNKAFTELTGYQPEEVLGNTLRVLHSGRHDHEFYEEMWAVILREGFWQGEIWNRRKDGHIYPEWLSITAVRNDAGRTTHYIGASFDITRRVESESEIRNLAFYDPLTGLPNRRLFADRLGQAFAKSSRSHKFGAVLYVDLDRFKEVNDCLGHAEGDRLLEIVADRLATNVREGDTVSRFGGDEFVVLLEDVDSEREAALELTLTIAEKLRTALNLPYNLHGTMPSDWHCSPSIGVAVFRGLQEDMESVLIRADRAMYSAKGSGRNTVCVAGPNGSQ